jgi:hypothetical protein
MKVKEIIETLNYRNPEEEVVILWWTKDIFDDEDDPITDDNWNKSVLFIDNSNALDYATEQAYDSILEVIREEDEVSA